MLILGIDPGIRKLGYALIDDKKHIIDAGTVMDEEHVASRQSGFERAIALKEFFLTIKKKYKPDVVSIEKLFFTEKNKNNAEFVYGVRMLLIDLFWDSAIIKEFSPIELKKNITGNGKADKILVKQTVSKIFHLKQQATLSDAADALGLAYCGYKIEAQQYILNVDRKK